MRLVACVAWTGAGALVVSGAASASFIGFAADTYQSSPSDSKWTLDLYATYSSKSDVLLNVYNAKLSITGGFGTMCHNDLVGTSWSPQLATSPATDSFLLIGGAPSFGNMTTADPNWGPDGFNQTGIPLLAGWYNSDPSNLQGKAQDVLFHDGSQTIAVHVGRFVTLDANPGAKHLTISAWLTSNQGLGTPGEQLSGEGDFLFCPVPTPGVAPMLFVAALPGRRRRRA